MPESLREYLKSVPDDVASQLWEWLDGAKYGANEMIDVLLESHPAVAAEGAKEI